MVKNLCANSGDVRDTCSIPGLGTQSIGLQRVRHGRYDLTCTQDHWQFRSCGHLIQSLSFYEGPRVN